MSPNEHKFDIYDKVKITTVKCEVLFFECLYSLRLICIKIMAGVKNKNEMKSPTTVIEIMIPIIPNVNPTVPFVFITNLIERPISSCGSSSWGWVRGLYP